MCKNAHLARMWLETAREYHAMGEDRAAWVSLFLWAKVLHD